LNGTSADGQWLGVFRSYTPSLYLYRLPGIERVAQLALAANVRDFQFSPSGDVLAVATRSAVEFWNTADWQRTGIITNFIDVLYTPKEGRLWLTRNFHSAGLYDAGTLAPVLPLPTGMLPLALSPDGRRLVVSLDTRRLQVWDLVELRRFLRDLNMDWTDPGP
jgi:hypothetical protein